uniref:ATP synthase F0 subunit 6 n=1 Tax=Halticus minutus TaxID=2917254 RepID=UPI001F140D5E|nr:ATP synthase F0 subunit 6 [Halticus minutus]UKT60745.1 ATP synthase F0 subunit 6 [Halticus minutus]
MMTNLFSTFDPSTNMSLSLNWMSTFIGMMIIPMNFWMMTNRIKMTMNMVIHKLFSEFKMLFSNNSMNLIMVMSLFMFIILNNIMGLLPYIFTSSSHMSFSLTLALPMWVGLMLFGWANKTQKMFAHLIPKGTPPPLIPFMVVIETISNMIRPGSLAVRLSANMIAGHLLMSLLGNKAEGLITPLIIMFQMMLMLFETAVAIIQAYVFSVLSTLYSQEVN